MEDVEEIIKDLNNQLAEKDKEIKKVKLEYHLKGYNDCLANVLKTLEKKHLI